MYQKVLIPLDGSPFAERVLSHVERLISPKETELLLLRVIEPFRVSVPQELTPLPEAASAGELQKHADAYLNQVKGELHEMGLQVQALAVAGGDVASVICDVADAQGADLIAMTTHGRSGLSRWAFGSVAERVLRTASQPIFLVRAATEIPPAGTFGRILVPLDGSELAEQALPEAQTLAREKGAEILLVRAIEPLSDRDMAVILATWKSADEIYAHRQTAAERYLGEVQEKLRLAGVPAEMVVDEGPAAEVILDTAEAEEVDMIVMSTHGRSGLSRWVYGSVAEKVLRRATCPLLLIRARSESQPAET